MVARMTYFRTKWRALPAAYARFLAAAARPGRAGHPGRGRVALAGGAGRGTARVPGGRPGWTANRRTTCAGRTPRHPMTRQRRPNGAPTPAWGWRSPRGARAHGPSADPAQLPRPASPRPRVATDAPWYTERGEPADRLLVPSFVLGDPWRTINAAAMPYWTFFSVQPALRGVREPPRTGRAVPVGRHPAVPARGPLRGIATPEQWRPWPAARRRARCSRWTRAGSRTTSRPGPLRPRAGRAAAGPRPWSPLPVDEAMGALRATGADLDS